MCAIVIGVDPLQLRPWGPAPRLMDGNYPELITAKLARAVTQERQDVILIGSSTAMGPTPRQLRATFGVKRAINLAYSSPYPIDTGLLMRQAIATPGLRRLIVELHFSLIEMNHKPAATGGAAISVIEPRWYALPDFENAIARASVRRVLAGYFTDVDWTHQRSDYLREKRILDQPQKLNELAVAAQKIPPSVFQSVSAIPCTRFQFIESAIIPVAREAEKNGVVLDLYFPPIPLATYPALETRDYLKTEGVDDSIFSQLVNFHRCVVQATNALKLRNVHVHAVDVDASITGDLGYYRDTVHLVEEKKIDQVLWDIKTRQFEIDNRTWTRYENLLSKQILDYHSQPGR